MKTFHPVVVGDRTWGSFHDSALKACHQSHWYKILCQTNVVVFDWFGFGQTSKTVVHSTYTKHLCPNKTNRWSAVQWYFSLSWCYLDKVCPNKTNRWSAVQWYFPLSWCYLDKGYVVAKKVSWGSGCGSVGKAVDSDTRGPRFKSRHFQSFYWILFTVNCIEKTKIQKKCPGMAHLKK